MEQGYKHVWNGICGLAAIAAEIETSVPSIQRRLSKGLTLDEAIADIRKSSKKVKKVKSLKPYKPKQPTSNKTPCKFPDKLSELWCLALGIGISTSASQEES